ncbi:hypothetical protein DY000_02051001 [Brassica cretica]|uniref:PUM-HD domain-containing protein n=1 Tax=Brassica cretica TaxID=69181 RepID=A0ABQ7F1A5_BRACR|nr:hypothetical protein DY000_02051001 [Brassica cretica]
MSSHVPRNRTPDSHLVGRSPSSGLPPIGTRVCGPVEKNNLFGIESYTDVADTLSRLNMSEMSQVKDYHMRVELENHSDIMRYIPNGHKKALRQQSIAMTEPSDQLLSENYGGVMSGYGASLGASSTVGSHGEHVNIPKRTSSSASHYSTSDRSRLGRLGLSDVNIQNANINGTDFSTAGGYVGSSHVDIGSTAEASLLDGFKNNKTRSLEPSEIVGHVIEFSMDQYGSRFIQQKLETATDEEKNSIFPEILPYGRNLMTDVFENYVIQKALEVVDLEQQARMVKELDGSVLKCVHDQNGNHVIQKCIERLPQDCIQFIISSFYGKVLALSTHPYGCRVIQRVLEHIDDTETQRIIMEEIMHSVCTLAQDQYGNYVIQHIIKHGKPQEQSEIINKLAGQIVTMSQQKFASNVVEKCLTFGGPEERQ